MGRIGPAHGLRGSVVVDPETDVPEQRFAPGAVVFLAHGQSLTVADYEATDRSPLVRFEEVTDRTAAEAMRGMSLYIRPDQRRPLGADEYWPDEMAGMAVELVDGTYVGIVAAVEPGLSQDRLVVATAEGEEVIIPLVRPLVPEVDLERRRLRIDPPPGLID